MMYWLALALAICGLMLGIHVGETPGSQPLESMASGLLVGVSIGLAYWAGSSKRAKGGRP